MHQEAIGQQTDPGTSTPGQSQEDSSVVLFSVDDVLHLAQASNQPIHQKDTDTKTMGALCALVGSDAFLFAAFLSGCITI